MRVHLNPTGMHSRAMVRISRALSNHAPSYLRVVTNPDRADLHVLYVISADAIPYARALRAQGRRYAVVQCCLLTAGASPDEWSAFWDSADGVWSYYDLSRYLNRPFDFYHAPLGLDSTFRDLPHSALTAHTDRAYTAVTTGYVSGPGAEAIAEVWAALAATRQPGFHVGPPDVHGMPRPAAWDSAEGLTDRDYARTLCESRYVVSLRHTEGFELPAAEGLACGARPVLFDQRDLRVWYGNWPVYIPETSGPALTDALIRLFSGPPLPVAPFERRAVLARFNWQSIATGFWSYMHARTSHTNQFTQPQGVTP